MAVKDILTVQSAARELAANTWTVRRVFLQDLQPPATKLGSVLVIDRGRLGEVRDALRARTERRLFPAEAD